MHTTLRPNPTFDGVDFECALKAADFDRCHRLIDGSTTLDGVIATARLALRERRFLDVIGLLSDFPEDSGELRIARDVFLGAAFGYTRDYVAGQRLIDRALNDLLPGDPLYDEAHYLTASIAWMQHDHQKAEEAAMAVLRSSNSSVINGLSCG